MRTLWCLRKACGVGYASVGGDIPTVCPGCLQPALWTTLAPAHAAPKARSPQPFTLTENDGKLLARHHRWLAILRSSGL